MSLWEHGGHPVLISRHQTAAAGKIHLEILPTHAAVTTIGSDFFT
jgi:hypothetical protein